MDEKFPIPFERSEEEIKNRKIEFGKLYVSVICGTHFFCILAGIQRSCNIHTTFHGVKILFQPDIYTFHGVFKKMSSFIINLNKGIYPKIYLPLGEIFRSK